MPRQRSERPNILLITSDQHRGDCYGFEGRKVRTPHLDMLARDGTRFSTCITPNVVCQPSRASILTGLLPTSHGVSDNGIDLPAETGEAGFAGALSRNGYITELIGKAHFSSYFTFQPTGTPECIESSAGFPEDWAGPYMGFQKTDMVLVGHNYWLPFKPPQGMHYERWYHGDGRGDEKNKLYKGHAPKTPTPQTFHSQLPEAWHNTTWVGNRAIDFIRTHRNEPFCVWASFSDPHHPFDAPEPWSRLHHPDEVDIPEHRTRDFERRPWWHRAAVENTPQLSGDLLKLRSEYSRIEALSEAQLRELTANYYGMISLIDHNVGRILTELDDQGLADNTIVIFTTDHGDWLGDHGLVLKGPMMYDGLLRVGMIVRGPGVPPGQVIKDPVSTVDLFSTILDYAQTSPGRQVDSRSLRPLIERQGQRDFAYNEWDLRAGRVGVALDLRTVRTQRHRMTIEVNSGAGELYDLQEDPHELHNRYEDPAHRNIRRELADMISQGRNGLPERRLPVVGTA
ncbi:sulfatase-like hydrolase/transferase [Alcaligenaceae bacterium]|nr:sulfatase-like hydrolase/transferase [Alcaligenaceae bacterium]